jgi:anaerobic selenocysteine-containing dehydrogenase
MDRRDFIKIGSILTAGSTVLTSCGKNMVQTVASTIPDNQMDIGEERRVPSVCNGCGAGCGVEVRWVDGRAIKLEGAPEHPVNRGRLCARGQSELQLLYNPDRVRAPKQGSREITWDQAIDTLAAKLHAADPRGIAVLTPRLSGLRAKVVDDFLTRLGAPPRVEVEPLSEAVVRHTQVLPDFDSVNYVLSFGAPLVEAGSSLVRWQRGLAHMRQGRPGRRGKLVQVESRYSLTAAYADEWVYLLPGTEGALALAIGHAPGWDFAKAAAVTGVPAARIERLAKEFAQYQPGIAVIGGAAAGHTNSAAMADAVVALNGHEAVPSRPTRTLADIAGKPALQQVVLVIGCNPLYEFPGAIASGTFIASFSSFPDETAEAAQLLLPNHTALEAWHQSMKETESIVVKPAVMPLYQTRDAADVLLQLSAKLGKPAPEASWKEMLDTTFSQEKPHLSAARPKTSWEPPVFQGTGEFHFQVYAGIALGTGDAANIPWLQELPDPLAQNVWGSALEMNPKTAARMGLADGDTVTIEAPRGRATARIAINPAAAPNVVAMAAGQGHTALGRYAKNRGVNAFALIDPEHWAATRVNVRRA